MESNPSDLKKLGVVSEAEVLSMSRRSYDEVVRELRNPEASARSAAAIALRSQVDEAASALLKCLNREKCPYTRVALCETLERGNGETMKKMMPYLGCIGKNQHRHLPERVSDKLSYARPRDLIARTMARMNIMLLPTLLTVLELSENSKLCEGLDAIGMMVYQNPRLATPENLYPVLQRLSDPGCSEVAQWKGLRCLSAFALPQSVDYLSQYAGRNDVLGQEARHSLKMIEKKTAF